MTNQIPINDGGAVVVPSGSDVFTTLDADGDFWIAVGPADADPDDLQWTLGGRSSGLTSRGLDYVFQTYGVNPSLELEERGISTDFEFLVSEEAARIAKLEERNTALTRDLNQAVNKVNALRIDLAMAHRQREEAQSEAHRLIDRLSGTEQITRDVEQTNRELADRVIGLQGQVSASNDTLAYAASMLPANLAERMHGYAVAKGVNQ